MTASYWKQVREAEGKATGERWIASKRDDGTAHVYCPQVGLMRQIVPIAETTIDNADFIAIAREAVPKALARIEELEAALAPLAAIADAFDVKRGTGAYRDDDMVQGWHVTGLGGELVERGLTVGMLRAARVALGKP